MARADVMNLLYSKNKSPLEFQWDNLYIPPMYNYLSSYDIQALNNIATSIKYSANMNKKYKAIDEIMKRRGFKKFASGTNRVVYNFLEDQSFLAKIALDRVGLSDNPNEYNNQFYLKPFVAKTFQVSQCGTIALSERVQPITSRAEFESIANDAFNLLTHLIGKYILEDIGTKYFMNFGLRVGFGVTLLDYPYLYKLDGNKLYCNKFDPITHKICDGVIDYDDGFNDLKCTKCGKIYKAVELKQAEERKEIIIKGDNDIDLNIRIKKGDTVIKDFSKDVKETSRIIRKRR